jgi:pyruvate,water dikinase
MKTVLDASIPDRRLLGGKAAALAALRHAGLPIPEWFVFASDAAEVDREECNRALAAICRGGERVAVRSSAFDEDGNAHSFAGQFESFLFVAPEDVPEKVAAVRRSAMAARVASYSEARGARLSRRPPAALIQRMVDADAAGVAFSADPVTGRRGVAVVSAVFGLGASLVEGEADADVWRVDRAGRIVERNIVVKQNARRFIDGAIVEVPLTAEQTTCPAITDEQVCEVARMARAAERHFGRPQDIEWAMENGQLYLLQSRPITSIAQMADPDGARALWDNSNIAESYGGVTAPLTFSFARRAYEEVYRQFCRLLRVPETRIDAHAQTFRRMLGLIRGRVYYNLLNWYRVLALLPGFKINRRFMEQMMGVRESLPDELLAELEAASPGERLKDIWHLLGAIGGLGANHFLLPRRIDAFRRRLDESLRDPQPAIESMGPDELAAYYRELEGRLLTRWDAPLINDFFAMIFAGALRRLADSYLRDESLVGALLGGEGGVISAEPALRVREMARLAAAAPDFARLLGNGSLEEILDAVPRVADFAAQYESYLSKFGDRCLDELKLESETLLDDPLPLLRTIGQLAEKPAETPRADESGHAEPQPRAAAEARMRAALGRHPLRRAIFHWTLKHARNRVRERENLRFERTRLFGRVRRVFVELGRRFHALDLLAEPRDIFYLEVEEALGFVDRNFLYTPIAEAEFIGQYRAMQPYLRPQLVLMAEREGRPVGFLFALPDWAQAQRGQSIDTIVIKTVAVLPLAVNGRELAGLGNALVARCHADAAASGYSRAIHALMHDANNSRNLSSRYAQPMRRYVLLAKQLK